MPELDLKPVSRQLNEARNWDEAFSILTAADPQGLRHGYLLWLAWRSPPGAEE